MSNLTPNEVRGLMEAYAQVYSPQETLEEEIFECIAYTLISQGYSAIDVLEYFVNVDAEVIVEDIINISEGTFIIESTVSEEYIEEQYEILNEAVPLLAAAGGLAARVAPGLISRLAPRIAQAATKLGQRASTQLWKQGSKATPMGRFPKGTPTAPGTKLIGNKNILQRGVDKVKDISKAALDKLPGGSKGKLAQGLKTAGKWALGGAAWEAGSRGVKALAGDDKKSPSETSSKSEPSKSKWNASAAKGGQLAFKAGGGKAAMEGGKSAEEVQKKGMEALKARKNTPDTAAGFDKAFASARDLGQKEFEWRGKKYNTQMAHTNLFDIVDGELLDETPSTPYHIVLNYLFENGHVDTLEEAHYVMLEMDAETIQSIVEEDSIDAMRERAAKRRKQRYPNGGGRDDFRPYTKDDYKRPQGGYLGALDKEAEEKKKKERNDNEEER